MNESRTEMGIVIKRDDGAGHMPQKQQHHQSYDEKHLDECGFQVGDGAADQIRAVIDGNDFHAGRQGRLNLVQFRFDAINHLQGVLALPHDHNAGNNLAVSIQIGYAAAQIGAEHHLANVFHANRSAVFAGKENNIFEIAH